MLDTKKPWSLSEFKLFESLPKKDLEQVVQMAPSTNIISISKGTLVQTPEVNTNGLSIVIEGKLRLYKTNADGKQYTVGILGPGDMYGESVSFSFGTNGNYMETMENTIICSVIQEKFDLFLSLRPELALKLLEELSNRLRDRDEVLERLALSDLRGKVLFFLTKLSKKFGVEENGYQRIEMSLTHQELANMIGATRESVSLVLQEFSNEGIIITSRKSIMVQLEMAKERLENT
ncbi:Crp/Fnr family transcriptional regulator [Paenibacillus sp. CGMCC 1.16610]|uniref:Helix-turn-helix domain-containing protein n=1 Tax=Paenibacillus anseongense TaxID=2682845 RepID=A0ABW9U8G4_9BACL|nr:MULTISPECIES: Crp/Fnr family transcriptional regulator [Paenibacillus]MBA2937229.1 Crp/Fnr family transcriptional regulator [Paenibacillus sp. CGMCC 1.16610]MVQ36288.1 helix-turn-helix domain-containing protein [Paenibacillus anseongense]